MVIKSCMQCEFHNIKEGEEGTESHCGKENCWSKFSKCVSKKALTRFLDQEITDRDCARAQLGRP